MQILPQTFFFKHPVVFGKAEGSLLKVLIEIYAKAADSINEESKPNALEINNFSSTSKLFKSDINNKLLTPPPEKIQESILKSIDILIIEINFAEKKVKVLSISQGEYIL